MKAKFSTILILLFGIQLAFAQSGRIAGLVIDEQTGEALTGANVFLDGTGIGAATDLSGEFFITGVPAGSYALKVIYVGYNEFSKEINVAGGEDLVLNIGLQYMALEGEKIVVTAQAEGQIAAINQQLSADAIKNVVSSKQIRELPDANAAESIRRLPGVNITRVGGEGNKVVIRGLEPKFNAITIDGVRMASSDKDNRSSDLSMISSSMLEGIEVSKTITADQDADLLGGAVNFKIREAKGNEDGGLKYGLTAQSGYTMQGQDGTRFNNYKFVPSVEGRFLDQDLGVYFQANIERRNLSSNEFNAAFSPVPSSLDYYTGALTLRNIPRDKERLNGALVMDYRLPEGSVSFSNFLSSGTTKTQDRNEQLSVASNQHLYSLNYRENTVSLIHNTIGFEHSLPWLEDVTANLKLSHSYSETKTPDEWSVSFFQTPANLNQFVQVANVNPRAINDSVYSDPELTRLHQLQSVTNLSRERLLNGSLDFSFPLNFSELVTSEIKFGAKWKTQTRSYKAEVYSTNATITSPSARAAAILIAEEFGWAGDPNSIPLSVFVDPDYNYGDFINNDFTMRNPMDFDLIQHLMDFVRANEKQITGESPEAYARNNYLSITNNYAGKEIQTAGYLMATVNIGRQLKIIPGIRYQNLRTSYSGTRGQTTTFSYNFYNHDNDTTVTQNNFYWLPNLNIQYKPVDWFDVRLAYWNTVSYPDFNAIIPRIDAVGADAINWNNYKLKPLQSENYDIYLSFHEPRVGLFTIGGFVKKIKNFIYPWTFYVPGRDADPYYLTNRDPNRRATYRITTFINNPYEVSVKGLELDWQTVLWYLPDPLNGLVFNINYTRAFSEAEYPFQYYDQASYTQIDSSYTDRLLQQPDEIINATLGFDYKDFSVRLSYTFQTNLVTSINQWEQMRGEQPSYSRWDLSFKQELPYGLQLYGSLYNLNDARDEGVLQMYPEIPTSIQTYGLSSELGLRWSM
jgi:TonB-dependent receptor